MPAGVEIGLLGPLQVRCDGVTVAVPAGKQRALLAALLLQAGRPVPADQLAELLWAPDLPPLTAPVALRNNVLRLRRLLGAAGQQLIQTRPGGYLITPGDCKLDLDAMEQELAAARAAARDGDWQRTAAHADASLGLWRGEPLSDVDLPALTAQHVPRLNEMRLQARELRIEADLALVRHDEAVTELPQLIAANPVRERLYTLLMLVLYRCGRRAEALAIYRSARDVLAGEIGVDPGPELQALHQQILHDDPALAAPPAAGTRTDPSGQPARTARAAELPRQLPAAVACFTGRDAELATLTGLLGRQTGRAAPALVITAIGGTAGVGKTALAVQWAHQVAEHFPDGQLYANLRGYDPGQPTLAADVLGGFLWALGVRGQDIPPEADERAARYRSLLAGQRMLIVLDNAGSVEQVRPLLPGSPGCVVLVTSRDTLAGLIARDGARRLDLDLLPLAEAVSLLQALIGRRIDSDPEAAKALAIQCARLPLALRVAAELATTRPAAAVSDLVAELADQQRRLDLMEAGADPRTAVRAVFSWSCRYLDADTARAFRLAGLHPGPDLDPYAVAALTGTSHKRAGQLLDQLVRAHLIQPGNPDRYGMHDLLRGYARELAAAQDGEEEMREALTRLFDYYLHSAATAMDVLFPAESDRRRSLSASASVTPPMSGEQEARVWLEAERASIVSVVGHAAEQNWPEHATQLAAVLSRHLEVGGFFPEGLSIHNSALRAAAKSGNVAAQAEALRGLGSVDMRQGRFHDAAGHYQRALTLFRSCGDRAGEGLVLQNLGSIESRLGRLSAAAEWWQQALTVHRELGHPVGAARALSGLGALEFQQGRNQEAADLVEQALALFREAGDRLGEANSLVKLGVFSGQLGRLQEATAHFGDALNLHREIGHQLGVAEVLTNLGELAALQGDNDLAISHLDRAVLEYRAYGDQFGEIIALRALGEALHGAGRTAAGRAQIATALGLAVETGNTYQQAAAHHSLAENYHSAGEDEPARRHWQQALDLYTQLGAPEADQIRSRLRDSV